MKNFKKIIAVSLSLAVMCVNPVSVSAEEIVTTTSMPYDDIDMPTVFSGVTADFSDGSAIDFKYCIGEFDIFNISVKNLPENLGYAHGYFNFDVTVDDTVYTVQFPWNIYGSNDFISETFSKDVFKGFSYICWNVSYAANASDMDSELCDKIYDEFVKCKTATFEILYVKEKEDPATTTVTSYVPVPEDTNTYTITTAPIIVTTTVPVSTRIEYGDANLDGIVDVADVVAVSAYVSNPSENSLDEYGITCGDVHNKGDGITANDALMIQKFISGDISDFN